ncbi:hypothetical protein [Streptomyces sp. NPDC091268]|uniref:hypothetical protein n=1 Tax=Streptomyces sp. NPDC091268 TaxID=3365979 RepID=UPI0037F92A91
MSGYGHGDEGRYGARGSSAGSGAGDAHRGAHGDPARGGGPVLPLWEAPLATASPAPDSLHTAAGHTIDEIGGRRDIPG